MDEIVIREVGKSVPHLLNLRQLCKQSGSQRKAFLLLDTSDAHEYNLTLYYRVVILVKLCMVGREKANENHLRLCSMSQEKRQ